MEAREARRDRTWRYGRRAQREHMRVVHPTGEVDCVCELSVWKFAKGKSVGCGCRKRQHGAPKVGAGMCYGSYNYREAVVERIAGKRLCAAWKVQLSGRDPLDIEL